MSASLTSPLPFALRINCSLNLSAQARADMYSMLADMASTKMPLSQLLRSAIDKFRQRERLRGINPDSTYGRLVASPVIYVFESMLQSGSRGKTLIDGLKDFVPTNEFLVLKAAESGGNAQLAEGFSTAAKAALSSQRLMSIVRSGIAKAFVSLVLVIGIVYYMAGYMAPKLRASVQGLKLPDAAENYFSSVDQIAAWLPFGVVITVGVIALLFWLLANLTGNVRQALNHRAPVFTAYHAFVASSLLNALSSMLATGMRFSSAIGVIKDNANPYVREGIERMFASARRGFSTGMQLSRSGLIPAELTILIEMFAEMNTLDERLPSLAERSLIVAERRIKRLSNMIATVLMAVVVLFIVWTYSALMSLGDIKPT
ncbi:MAG: hypothetical protein D6712_18225 [Chloroflexi bacterium]|nr:MAG: hypothetical protein D6712_18225 [Chloroflexota bacterium]